MNSNDVRHIMKDHGDPQIEKARGQIAVTADDIALIPQVLASPDNVYLSSSKDGKGRTVLVFEKQIGGRYITMQGISDGKHALETDTLYIRKQKDSQDTGHNAANGDPVINAQSVPPQSPSSDTTLPQAAQNSNNNLPEGTGAASSGFAAEALAPTHRGYGIHCVGIVSTRLRIGRIVNALLFTKMRRNCGSLSGLLELGKI